MLKAYAGGCHCGAVRFEADLDLAAGTGKCNCSYCRKIRLWSVQVSPEAFRLVAGAEALTDYRGGNAVAQHPFCARCGIHVFDRIDMPNMTGAAYYNINLACLDDLDLDELMAARIRYFDGRNDAWGSRPAEVRHL